MAMSPNWVGAVPVLAIKRMRTVWLAKLGSRMSFKPLISLLANDRIHAIVPVGTVKYIHPQTTGTPSEHMVPNAVLEE